MFSFHMIFWDKVTHWHLSILSRWARKPRVFFCVCLPGAETTSWHHCACFLRDFWESPLKPLLLHGKHFTQLSSFCSTGRVGHDTVDYTLREWAAKAWQVTNWTSLPFGVLKEGNKVGLSWDRAVAWNVLHHYSQLSLLISSDSSALRKWEFLSPVQARDERSFGTVQCSISRFPIMLNHSECSRTTDAQGQSLAS